MEVHDIICDGEGCEEHAMKSYRHYGPSVAEIRKACLVMGWKFQDLYYAYCPTCWEKRKEQKNE